MIGQYEYINVTIANICKRLLLAQKWGILQTFEPKTFARFVLGIHTRNFSEILCDDRAHSGPFFGCDYRTQQGPFSKNVRNIITMFCTFFLHFCPLLSCFARLVGGGGRRSQGLMPFFRKMNPSLKCSIIDPG